MSDTQVETEPETTPSKPPRARRRVQPAPQPSDAETPAPEGHAVEAEPEPPVAAAPADEPAPAAAESAPDRPARRTHRASSASGFPWERSPLAEFTVAELLGEVEARRSRAARLGAERDRIVAEMARIEAELAAMGASVDGSAAPSLSLPRNAPRRPRARNSVSLADAIAMAVEPRAVVSPAEAVRLVLANGYVTTAGRFSMIVANALSKDGRFKRIGRGQYERIHEAGAGD
jgi:hypothetical protein